MFFIGEVSTLLANENIIVIYDYYENAPSHWDCLFHAENHDVKTLPRYNPLSYNMTERETSGVKSGVIERFTEASVQVAFDDRAAAIAEGITLKRHIKRILKLDIEEALKSITPLNICFDMNNQPSCYFQCCLERRDIFLLFLCDIFTTINFYC